MTDSLIVVTEAPIVVYPPPDPETLLLLRMGNYGGPWHGVELIGYTGIAILFGYQTRSGAPAENTVRKLTGTPWFPKPRFRTGIHRDVLLFDLDEIRTYGIRTHRLAPDGVTPQRRKPHRGPGRAKRRGG